MQRCSKYRYRSEIGAKLALANIRHTDSSRRPKQEQRAYRCPACHGWHLTSNPLRKTVV